MTHPDEEISARYREEMNMLAKALDYTMNGGKTGDDRDTGFVLLVFPFGEEIEGRVNYISNGANRKDIVILMREMIARFEGQPEIIGKA